jgi:hypothetical protein
VPAAERLVVDADPGLAGQLRELAGRRMVFLAGLPGTGKSLLVHQIAHLAGAAGRRVQLLQWDVARPPFESSPAGRRYPIRDGVTHAMIRKAAGLWARRAVAGWSERHPGAEDLLIGETPFVGGRFVELARPVDDRAEPLLAAESCRFAIATPSVAVRRFLEAERERRAVSPLHPREREDAPPQVLRDLWRDLAELGHRLGLGAAPEAGATPPYDPEVYRRVYERVLRDRQVDVVRLDTILPTQSLSVYDYAEPLPDVAPTEAEAEDCIREIERRHPDPAEAERDTARWWEV